MAKAKKVPADFSVELTLTHEEASALLAVCLRIGGPASTTRRIHFDAISSELHSLGILSESNDIGLSNNSIWFTPR